MNTSFLMQIYQPFLESFRLPAMASVQASASDDAERSGLPVKRVGSVAVVSISGPMYKNVPRFWRDSLSDTALVRAAFRTAIQDADVESVLLRIDSPGGSVDGLSDLVDEVFLARGKKPVVAQVDGMAASAAYEVASQADEIVSSRMDLVGSIGSRMLLYDWSRMFENDGIRSVVLDTGEHKSTGAIGAPITAAQEAELQRIVDQFGEDFIQSVVRGRKSKGLNEKRVRELADGRIWTAPEALELGLIDRIGNYEDTLALMTGGQKPSRSGASRVRAEMMRGRIAGV